MKNYLSINIVCPNCRQEFEHKAEVIVDVKKNPELREEILSKRFFIPECPHCGNQSILKLPVLYKDFDRGFMVHLNEYGNVMDVYEHSEKLFENNGYKEGSKVTFVTTINDLITAIIASEQGLDYRVIKLCELCEESFFKDFCEKEGEEFEELEAAGILYRNNEIHIGFTIKNKDGKELFTKEFEMELYDSIYEKYKTRMEELNPPVVDRNFILNFVENYEQPIKKYEKKKKTYVYCEELEEQRIILCEENPLLIKNRLEVGQLVVVRENGKRYACEIKNFVHWNPLKIAVPYESQGVIENVVVKHHYLTDRNQNYVSGQHESLDKLLEWKNENYPTISTKFPTEILKNLDLIICSITKEKSFFREFSDIRKKNEETGKFEPLKNLLRIQRGDKCYLYAFSDPNYLPSKEEYEESAVLNFKTLVNIVRNDVRYDGIILNNGEEEVLFDLKTIETYLIYEIMTNDENMLNFLTTLTPEEKRYIGSDPFMFIYNVYENKLSPKEISKLHNKKEKLVHAKLDEGYVALQRIATLINNR